MSNKLNNLTKILLPAIAYGDAAGVPVETLSAEEIKNNHGIISSLILDDTGKYSYSDDTQLSLAMARALISANKFDLNLIAEEHLVEYKSTPIIIRDGKKRLKGWGGSTEESVKRISEGISLENSGDTSAAGNGVLMKITPLVFFHLLRNTPDNERYNNYDALTSMTHNNDLSRVCTRVHADILIYLFNYGLSKGDFLSFVHNTTIKHERLLDVSPILSGSLDYLRKVDIISQEDILENTDGKGFYTPQTLAMTYGAFLLGENNFKDTVYAAVNLGGDTDSTASIVAGMFVFNNPSIILPEDHAMIEDMEVIKSISSKLKRLST